MILGSIPSKNGFIMWMDLLSMDSIGGDHNIL